MSFAVTTLDPSTWAAFAELVERNNGIFGGCWCTGSTPKAGRRASTDEPPNRPGSNAARLLYSATVELFEDFGFSRRRQVGKHAWIVDRIVEASS